MTENSRSLIFQVLAIQTLNMVVETKMEQLGNHSGASKSKWSMLILTLKKVKCHSTPVIHLWDTSRYYFDVAIIGLKYFWTKLLHKSGAKECVHAINVTVNIAVCWEHCWFWEKILNDIRLSDILWCSAWCYLKFRKKQRHEVPLRQMVFCAKQVTWAFLLQTDTSK